VTLLLTLAFIGITVGSLYALFAVSFGVIYNVTHVFHLAHGAVIAAVGYAIYFFVARLGWPPWLGIVLAVPLAAALGAAIELAFYRPLRRQNAPHVAFFLTSVGILIVAEGLFGTIFGPCVITYGFLPLAPVALGAASVPNANLAMLSAWAFVALAVTYVLATRTGRFMRAVADTPAVAASVGVDLERTYLVSYLLGSALTVPGVVLYVWAQGLTPLSGLNVLLVASAAVIIGGHSGLLSGAIAAFALGIVQALALVFLPSGWQDAVVFTLMFLVIVIRPDGVFGRAFRW
jgi:branched-subunit amino acid ABC-type transport system permease component